MTTCDEYKERIALLASDDLSEPERGPTLEHLAECASCRAEYDALLRLCGNMRCLAREDERVQLPAGLHERLARRMTPEPKFRRYAARAAFATAACVLLGLTVWLCAHGGDNLEQAGSTVQQPAVPVPPIAPLRDDAPETWAAYRYALLQSPETLDSLLLRHEGAMTLRTPDFTALDVWRFLNTMDNDKEEGNETRNTGCRPACDLA